MILRVPRARQTSHHRQHAWYAAAVALRPASRSTQWHAVTRGLICRHSLRYAACHNYLFLTVFDTYACRNNLVLTVLDTYARRNNRCVSPRSLFWRLNPIHYRSPNILVDVYQKMRDCLKKGLEHQIA